MENNYSGCIVEESLEDNRILNSFTINKIKITNEENPSERWHLYFVKISEKQIELISKNLKEKWYAHFWKGKEVIAVFKDKMFKFNHSVKSSWNEAVNYGLSIGIKKEQLDFPID